VELSPVGEMVYIENWDKPGLIGGIGTLFAKHDINIAAMTFGRDVRGGKAISVLNIDSPVSADTLAKLRKLENILTAKIIRL